MLSCFAHEILFKEIDLVVLSDALGDSINHVFGGLGEAQSGIPVHLLGVLCLIGWLSWVDVCGPTTLSMPHSLVSNGNSIGVNAMLGQRSDVG